MVLHYVQVEYLEMTWLQSERSVLSWICDADEGMHFGGKIGIADYLRTVMLTEQTGFGISSFILAQVTNEKLGACRPKQYTRTEINSLYPGVIFFASFANKLCHGHTAPQELLGQGILDLSICAPRRNNLPLCQYNNMPFE